MSSDYAVVVEAVLDIDSISRELGFQLGCELILGEGGRREYRNSRNDATYILSTEAPVEFDLPTGKMITAMTTLLMVPDNGALEICADDIRALASRVLYVSEERSAIFFNGECVAFRLPGSEPAVYWPDWHDAIVKAGEEASKR